MNDAYLHRRRRMLLDMHVPDWDPGFLANHDPKKLVRCYELANVNAVMLYCKSHVGLAYWPTSVGTRHANVQGDAVGETITLLHERDILVCGYTSISYDNHVVDVHPDWSVVPANSQHGEATHAWPRYGIACMSRPDYLAYEKDLISELLERYPFDAFFLDMAFWPSICVCDACRRRLLAEEGIELPTQIDWHSEHPRAAHWLRFQAARERWADEFMQELIEHARNLADIPVYQNFSVAFAGWRGGRPLRTFRNDAFLGADLTGGRDEQLFAIKLMRAASPHLPAEYMTPRAPSLSDHVSAKTESEMTLQAFGAVALDSAILFIDAIDADGRVDADVYEQIGKVYQRIAPYEDSAGGVHIEDVGVYFSSEACVDLAQNGTPLDGSPESHRPGHLQSALGATRLLQRAHVASGVVTYRQLGELSRYKVLVVPDLTRITDEEVDAFRSYVRDGGRLYASGRTSLLGADGVLHEDFLLADVFGVRFVGEELGPQIFLCPVAADVATVIAPQKHVGWELAAPYATSSDGVATGPPRVAAHPEATLLATLSLPYDYPEFGTHRNKSWASVYGVPPWQSTDHATLVENQPDRGSSGRSIYSTFPLERGASLAAHSLFVAMVKRLLGTDASVIAEDVHPAVWLEAFHQPERSRFVVNLLNFPDDLRPVPIDVTFAVAVPAKAEVAGVHRALDGEQLPFDLDDHVVRVTTGVQVLETLIIDYAGTNSV